MNVPLLALPVETTTAAISLVLEFGVFQQNWPKPATHQTSVNGRFSCYLPITFEGFQELAISPNKSALPQRYLPGPICNQPCRRCRHIDSSCQHDIANASTAHGVAAPEIGAEVVRHRRWTEGLDGPMNGPLQRIAACAGSGLAVKTLAAASTRTS